MKGQKLMINRQDGPALIVRQISWGIRRRLTYIGPKTSLGRTWTRRAPLGGDTDFWWTAEGDARRRGLYTVSDSGLYDWHEATAYRISLGTTVCLDKQMDWDWSTGRHGSLHQGIITIQYNIIPRPPSPSKRQPVAWRTTPSGHPHLSLLQRNSHYPPRRY